MNIEHISTNVIHTFKITIDHVEYEYMVEQTQPGDFVYDELRNPNHYPVPNGFLDIAREKVRLHLINESKKSPTERTLESIKTSSEKLLKKSKKEIQEFLDKSGEVKQHQYASRYCQHPNPRSL